MKTNRNTKNTNKKANIRFTKLQKKKQLLNHHCDLQCQVASLEKSVSSSYFSKQLIVDKVVKIL